MFKALLKTLPSLSGNMKLSCFVDDYKRHNKTYTCNVKVAKLLPIAHTLFDKNIYVNLKNNSFEYDVKKFYSNYFDTFYKTNYNYSKINIPIIDFTNNVPDGNEDFQFGCKRISYSKYENQMAFFAPIYIESLDDIKDKYFKITCIFNKVNTLKKELIIDIYNNEDGENYLGDYLQRYASKIDDKVIYMSSTYKNMYHGIDLLHGGFIHIEDNISKNLYKQYYTINDFDAIINFGFKRNNMMMKQIIPLSFYFNPQNLLTLYEQSIFNDAEIIISGEWYTKGSTKAEKFYNFSDNYTFYSESVYQLTSANIFTYVNSSKNILDMNYPAFKEASSENYKYINTIVKNYNRWKLKYSSDNYPYIINNNFAFSNNQNSLYSYKEFPLIYKTKDAICKFKGENYNMYFDLNDIEDSSGNLLNIKSDYYDYFNKNYITNFYNLLVKHSDNTYDNIFTNDEYWTTINSDNKLYYKGVLYDFNIIYSQYKDMPKIDKFSIFVNPEMMSSISNFDYNTTYNSVKYTIHSNSTLESFNQISQEVPEKPIDTISSYIYKYDFINSNIAYITNNNIVYNDQCCAVNDKSGDYVDINAYYLNQQENNKLHYSDQNLYVDVKEILMYGNLFPNDYNKILYDKIYNNYDLNIINGYRIIDIKYKNNIISEIYSQLLKLYPNKKNQFNNDNLIYSEHKFLENDDIYWAYDDLYFSVYPNKIKYKLLENSELLYDIPYDTKITVYFKTDFILLNDLKNLYKNDIDNSDDNYNNDLNNAKLNKYYISNTLYDKNDKQSYSDICFIKLKEKDNHYGKYTQYDFENQENHDKNDWYILNNFHEDVLFIDPYNLNKFYHEYFKEDNDFSFFKVENCYCNFLNMDHVHKYFNKLFNNENKSLTCNVSELLHNIFIKLHLLNDVVVDYDNKSGINFINTTTIHISLDEYFKDKDNNISSITLSKLLDYIGYDDTGYFYFTNNYFADYKDKLKDLPYSIRNFELCFKKTMGIVNKKLYELIMQLNSHNLFKDLYLYKLYDSSDYKFEYVLNNSKLELTLFENKDEQSKDQWKTTKIIDNEDLELYPYFNSIYIEEKIQTKIYNDTFLNNIIKSENSDTYKHAVHNIDCLVYLPKNDNNINLGLCPYRYSLYTKYNNCIVNSDMFVNKYMNYEMSYILQTIDNNTKNIIEKEISITEEIPDNHDNYTYTYFLNPNCSYSLAYNQWFKDYGKMITYNCNGTTYGFYIIHEEFDNTRNSLNLLSENFNKINVVSYINDIYTNTILNDQYTYLTKYYHNLVPYINNSNIVKDFLNNVNIVIKPNKYTLTNIYQQIPNNDANDNTTYSYNIIVKGKTSLQLLRYFDNITPYIYDSNSVTSYYLYYKNTDKFIENDLYNKKISYIMYQRTNNIYNDKQILYFDNSLEQNHNLSYLNLNISKFTPVEYKNYNHNKFYNLETSFSIKPVSDNEENKNLFTKKEIDEKENDEKYVYDLFKQHLLNENKMLTENDILFLYKKYDIKYSHTIKSFHKNSNGDRDYDLYTLTIKYNLY